MITRWYNFERVPQNRTASVSNWRKSLQWLDSELIPRLLETFIFRNFPIISELGLNPANLAIQNFTKVRPWKNHRLLWYRPFDAGHFGSSNGFIFATVQLIRRVLKSFLNFFLEKISVSGPLKGWTVKPPVRTTLIFSLKPKFRINKHDLGGSSKIVKTKFQLEIFESKSFLFFNKKFEHHKNGTSNKDSTSTGSH